ncbi:unnamed protein product [Effrenium voratum]|nr:unnamed protein product [Effrenium voratum]
MASPPPRVLGVELDDCCEGRLLGQAHSSDCPRFGLQNVRCARDEEVAMALQAAELERASSPEERLRAPLTYTMGDPVWGEVVSNQEPTCGFKLAFSCCPCLVVGCRSPDAKRAWRTFLCSVSFILSVIQVLILVMVIILDGGMVSYEENPMFGPHFHRLDAAGAKNAAKIVYQGQWWRLASATMLHAGWLHLAGNLLVQIRTGVQLEVMWGAPAWLVIYFVSGIYANLLSCVLHPEVLGVGSSGCLCGLIGGWLSFLFITWNQTMPGDVRMRNAQISSVLVSIVLIILFSFMPLMDIAAHVGGLAMGAGIAMAIFGNRLQDKVFRWATISAGICVVVVMLVVTIILFVTTTQIPDYLLELCQRPNC